MAKIKLDLDRTTPAEQLASGMLVIAKSSGNADFTAIAPMISSFQQSHYIYNLLVAAVDALEQQLEDAVILRKAGAPAFELAYSSLASAAEGVVAGDATKLTNGGWELQAPRQPPQPLGKVENVSLSTGEEPGELDAQWDRLPHASGYEAQQTTTPEVPGSWVPLRVPRPTRSQQTFPSLPSGTRLWVRVRGLGGTEGTGAWSEPASAMVP